MAMKKPDETIILKSYLDFENGVCDFKMSSKKYYFRDAVNTILKKLHRL